MAQRLDSFIVRVIATPKLWGRLQRDVAGTAAAEGFKLSKTEIKALERAIKTNAITVDIGKMLRNVGRCKNPYSWIGGTIRWR